MNTKSLFTVLVCTVLVTTTYAQDELHMRNGKIIEGKVIEVLPRTVTYKKYDNQDGPTYTINKADVAKIAYENGSVDDWYPTREEVIRTKKQRNYGNNILSFMPMQIATGLGIGIAYERVLDKNAVLSFYLPITCAFTQSISDPNQAPNGPASAPATYYFMPGLKFYPTGGKGTVRYSIGPNLVYIHGNKFVNDFLYDDQNNVVGQDIGWRTRTTLGVMLTNGLNINPSDHVHLGLDLGIGFSYLNKVNNRNTELIPLAQFGFKIGYRF